MLWTVRSDNGDAGNLSQFVAPVSDGVICFFSMRYVENELGKKGRVLLRKSGTEPVVRVMVEGEDAADVHTKAQRIADVIIHQSGCENA